MAAWRLCKGLVNLRTEINSEYPGRSKISDGSIGNAEHSARTSDHNPDSHGIVYAIDVTQDDPYHTVTPSDDVAEAVAEHLRKTRDPRVKYVIWRGRMFSSYSTSSRKAWEWGKYTGPNGHFHHVHISLLPGVGDLDRPFHFQRPDGRPLTTHWISLGLPKAGDPYLADRAIYNLGGEQVEVTEVQLVLKKLSQVWKDKLLDPGKIDGTFGPGTAHAVTQFKHRMIALQKLTGQLPWPNTDPGVGTNTIAALRFWNSQK